MINISIFRYLQNKHNSIINKMLTFLDKHSLSLLINLKERERESLMALIHLISFQFHFNFFIHLQSFQTKRVFYPKYNLYEVGVREC